MSARRVIEIATTGIDEALQALGSDPFGSMSWVGLRVPTLPTAAVALANGGSPDWQNRYLFAAASFSVGDGARARILGYRQLVTIGCNAASAPSLPTVSAPVPSFRFVEQEVLSPFWHFADVSGPSFHLWHSPGPDHQGMPANTPAPGNLRNFMFRTSDAPALLYETATVPTPFYVDLTAYTAPSMGKPWGSPLADGHHHTFYDLRTQHRTHGAWSSLDLEVEGPDLVTAYISVAQTDPQARELLTPPSPFYPGGLSAEEQFLLNFPTAIYWRVGFSLIVEIGGERTVMHVADETGGARRAP